MNNADMPAAPISVSSITHDICSFDFEYGEGLTKREHFAGLAMQGLLSHYGDSEIHYLAAVEYADALLKALENSND
tara:strand:- start:22 stop:249 length:228 start_codon:yes stop_codon:yes gene_type:complete